MRNYFHYPAAMPVIKNILMTAAVVTLAPFSAAVRGSPAQLTGSGADTVPLDTEYVTETAAPALSADSVLLEAASDTSLDSTLLPAPPDTVTAATVSADTVFMEDTSFFELIPETAEFADSAAAKPERRRPGVSLEQHLLARRMLDFFFDAAWDSSATTERKLARLEKKHSLPPLSTLLAVGIRVLRILHGEYENDRVKKVMIVEIDRIASRGLKLAEHSKGPDSCRAVNMLITGGIQGFTAALEIDRNPINAAINGFSSLTSLKKAVDADSLMRDAYLGVAMYHCVMSRAPAFVRGALALVGKKVSLERGLEHMRICAYGGSYTSEVALLLLAEFLSPYLESEAEEKRLIFSSLVRRYPHNPFFVFLEIEEDLCFHQENFSGSAYKERVHEQIRQFTVSNSSSRCYANLVKWQYLLLDPFPPEECAPDKEFRLRRFAYYPVFLQAVRENIACVYDSTETRTDRARRLRFIRAMGTRAERMLDASDEMPSNRKGFYLWHIRDALKTDGE